MAVYDVSGTQEDCYPNTTVLATRQYRNVIKLRTNKIVAGSEIDLATVFINTM